MSCKTFLNAVLFLIMLGCFLWQVTKIVLCSKLVVWHTRLFFALEVWDQVAKFVNGRTATTVERTIHKGLELPQITFCMQSHFKNEVLEAMGLPLTFFIPLADATLNGTAFPDLNDTWRKATHDIEIEYYVQSPMNTTSYMTELSTLYNGRCAVLTIEGEVGSKKSSSVKLYPMNGEPGIMYMHRRGSATGLAMFEWHSPHQSMDFFLLKYYEKELTKEYHALLPQEGAPCLERDELFYYKAN